MRSTIRPQAWTLERGATLEVMLRRMLFFNGQGFLVPAGDDVCSLPVETEATMSVVREDARGKLADYFHERGWSYQPMMSKPRPGG